MSAKDPLIGTKMGDYTIQSLLGRGGMARVYRGYDENLERYAAVKVIDAQLLAGDDSEEYYQRFQREARSIARLRHSNIVGIYQFGQAGSDYYMAMVFIDGRDLREILKEYSRDGKRLEKERVMKIMQAMTDALDYAHQNGVIHRDVKPSNILVTEDNTAVLTDFGLALNVPEGTIGNTFGSAHYIAPEQAVSSAQSVPQSDLYSLAICLYEMLTGRVPFDDTSAMSVALKHLSDPPPAPSQINADISLQVESVLMKALEKEPHNRYETGVEFMAALERAFSGGQVVDSSKTQTAEVASVAAHASADDNNTAMNGIQDSWRSATNASRASKLSPDEVKERTNARLKRVQVEFGADDEPVAERRRPWWLWVGVAVLVLAGLTLIAVLNREGGPDVPLTETAVAALSEPSPTAQSEETVPVAVDLATETETSTPPFTATVAASATEASETETPTPIATETPLPTDTDAPTETPAPTDEPTENVAAVATEAAENGPTVQLRYNDRTIVLYNSSGETVDVSGLVFVRTRASGAEITFRAGEWATGATASPRALPREDCFQVWTTRYTLLPVESYCDSRHGWRSVAAVNAFWRGDDGFEVRRGGDVVATCRRAPSICTVPVAP